MMDAIPQIVEIATISNMNAVAKSIAIVCLVFFVVILIECNLLPM